jgi:hypothetical protein
MPPANPQRVEELVEIRKLLHASAKAFETLAAIRRTSQGRRSARKYLERILALEAVLAVPSEDTSPELAG